MMDFSGREIAQLKIAEHRGVADRNRFGRLAGRLARA